MLGILFLSCSRSSSVYIYISIWNQWYNEPFPVAHSYLCRAKMLLLLLIPCLYWERENAFWDGCYHCQCCCYCRRCFCAMLELSQLVCFICKVFLSSSCTKMSWGAVFPVYHPQTTTHFLLYVIPSFPFTIRCYTVSLCRNFRKIYIKSRKIGSDLLFVRLSRHQ